MHFSSVVHILHVTPVSRGNGSRLNIAVGRATRGLGWVFLFQANFILGGEGVMIYVLKFVRLRFDLDIYHTEHADVFMCSFEKYLMGDANYIA